MKITSSMCSWCKHNPNLLDNFGMVDEIKKLKEEIDLLKKNIDEKDSAIKRMVNNKEDKP
jgi:hypothetical protein